LLPDLLEKGLQHPWLAGLPETIRNLRQEGRLSATREIAVDGRWYGQTILDAPDKGRTRVFAVDTSERKRAELVLADSERRYRIVADNTYDFEFWTNP
jgi:PAS domain-containing protein